MKKCYTQNLWVASVCVGAALLLSSTLAQAQSAHDTVVLRDATGATIAAPGGSVPASAPAFSAKQTCGACHDYDAMERHSYHAQLGANQVTGWNGWAYGNNFSAVASKGKPWVQSPGHSGAW